MGWTQDDLAEKLDVSRQTIISLEKGRYNPSLILAFKISKLFACRIEDIFLPEEE
ncbi:putative transcriptional regulator [Sporosarcina luteola]|nr:putative transcriptional regulator [Sporosarcina luteola]